MQLGATVGGFYDRIDTAPDLFDTVEVTIGGGSSDLDEMDTAGLTDRIETAGLTPTVHLPTGYPFPVPVREIRRGALDFLERALDTASEFDAQKAVTHASTDPHNPGTTETLSETVTDLSERAAARDVTLCVENVGHLSRGYDLETVGRVVADGDAAMCFDIGHAYLEVGNDGIRDFLSSYADVVSHVHVHVHDAGDRDDTHIPLGSGEVEPSSAVALSGRDVTAAVEVFTDEWSMLADTARRFRDAVEGESRQ
ncbi:MAG: sugar phosphate isomerase/epimerase family protein [Halobaculum sp.]